MSVYSNFSVNLLNKNSSWSLVADTIKDGSRVLDIGCSSGYFADVLQKSKKCIVDGIELNSADAFKAMKICSTVLIGNIEDNSFDLKLLEGKYDYILFIDVLEHLLNPSVALDRASTFLKKDGKIVFSIPNMANGSTRLQLLQGNFDYEKDGLLDNTHLHFYTAKTVDDMVKRSALNWYDLSYTTRDIDANTIQKCLSTVGLKYTSEFRNFLSAKDSVVYQFIGTLSKTKTVKPINFINQVSAIKPIHYYSKVLTKVQNDSRTTFRNLEILSHENIKKGDYIVELEQKVKKLEGDIEISKQRAMMFSPISVVAKALRVVSKFTKDIR